MTTARSCCAAVIVALSASQAGALEPIGFRDVRVEAGLGDVVTKDAAWYGGGVAFVDLDGDLWPDLFFGAGRGERDQLCRNTRAGAFRCEAVGPVRTTVALAVAVGDYDGDGDLDLYVMTNTQNQLLENDGAGHFEDVTKQRHAAGSAAGPTPTGTFFDYDGDGRLDLFLGGGDAGFEGVGYPVQVLRQGPDKSFTDVTAASGLALTKNTLSILAFDYDGDLLQDVLVTGNFDLVSLFHNEGGGRFVDVTRTQPTGFQTAVVEGMGADIADFDGDGDFDLYVTNSVANADNPGSGFFVNGGDGVFDSRAKDFGVLASFGWGTGWADFDNDTWPDLFVVGNLAETNFLYRNLGGQRFELQPLPRTPGGQIIDCVTAAFADYDRDGRVDAIMSTLNGAPLQLLHNETAQVGNWVSVLLEGKAPRDPLGALVEISTGPRVLRRQLLGQTSKGSQNERSLHFGVGDATSVDVSVTWPGGGTDHVTAVPVNRHVSIEQGCSSASQAWPAQCNALVNRPPPPLPEAGCSLGTGSAAARGLDRGSMIALVALGLARLLGRRRGRHGRASLPR